MPRTTNLRRQHDAALELVKQLAASIAGDRPSETEAYQLSLTLARLTGLLGIHFAMEDKSLYPSLIGSGEPEAATTAAAFQEEMGGLSAAYAAFTERWKGGPRHRRGLSTVPKRSAGDIRGAWRSDERENTTLYPLADNLDPKHWRQSA